MLFVLGDLVIYLHGCAWATLGQGLALIGTVLYSYSIHVIFELFEAFNLRATFTIWYQLSISFGFIGLSTVLLSCTHMHSPTTKLSLISIQGLIASRSNKQQPAATVGEILNWVKIGWLIKMLAASQSRQTEITSVSQGFRQNNLKTLYSPCRLLI